MAYNTPGQALVAKSRTDSLDTSAPLIARSRTITALPPRMVQSNLGDVAVFLPSKNISGTIYAPGGTAVAGATVKLFRELDDKAVKTGTTDAFGHYFFLRDEGDVFTYYVLGYTSATSPQVHGVSDRGNVPA